MIEGLSAGELLEVWERGANLQPIDRGLLLLSSRLYETSWVALSTLPLDQHDRLLLELRSATFGSKLEAFVLCTHCGEPLEYTLNATELNLSPNDSLEPWPGYTMRLPNTDDLRAASTCASPHEAAATIFSRCVQPSAILDVTDAMLASYSAWATQQAPGAEILLETKCPACTQPSSTLFDIATFFWREIEAAAAHLVREVDALARVYGWSEAQILAMTPARRGLYLQAANA